MQNKSAFVFDHPLIQHKISLLRNKETSPKDFRELTEEVSMLMAYEVTRDLPLKEIEIETPLAKTRTKVLSDRPVALVPILRAGLGMVGGFQKLIPNARVGHLGLYRDPQTHQPVDYYSKLPGGIADSIVIVLDPMFATGGSAITAIEFLLGKGCKDVSLVCMIAAQYAIDSMYERHPDIPVFCAAVDSVLNENAYIVPGLGDAGDRIFDT